MPRVLNKYKDEIPDDAVYIGRPSKWGNPYSHKDGTLAAYKVDTVEEAVNRYIHHLFKRNLWKEAIEELKGKDLVCFCTPNCCHGDILIVVANYPGATRAILEAKMKT